MSIDPNSDRRFTYSTNVNSQNDDKHQYTNMTPKLHVAEIISIQATERLAEILDPVYETIDYGVVNDGYHSYDRESQRQDLNVDDYYGFTKASSVSIGCPDWIQSTPESIYNSSFNEHPNENNQKTRSVHDSNKLENDYDISVEVISFSDENEYVDDTMLDEIMQYIDTNKEVQLNPDLLSPNRPDGDKIVFVDK